ncbi:hypothetical protein PVL29_025941 [Vitis rotundifolia]|uniref:Uncharacterized protein n=1 Tax=Vitis rotundifolia TaxID=103349 RepID=A0AA39D7Z0_VITRO|nr:hypothetical protein PVL29_025941 [Vitis rotundifolia]
MEPLPPLSKVFALVIQEERQRSINNGISSLSEPLHQDNTCSASVNAYTRNSASKGKREQPQCSHCGL